MDRSYLFLTYIYVRAAKLFHKTISYVGDAVLTGIAVQAAQKLLIVAAKDRPLIVVKDLESRLKQMTYGLICGAAIMSHYLALTRHVGDVVETNVAIQLQMTRLANVA